MDGQCMMNHKGVVAPGFVWTVPSALSQVAMRPAWWLCCEHVDVSWLLARAGTVLQNSTPRRNGSEGVCRYRSRQPKHADMFQDGWIYSLHVKPPCFACWCGIVSTAMILRTVSWQGRIVENNSGKHVLRKVKPEEPASFHPPVRSR